MICLLDVKSLLYNLQKTYLHKLVDIDKIIVLSYYIVNIQGTINILVCVIMFCTCIKDDPLQY